jgi:hypothetical protein
VESINVTFDENNLLKTKREKKKLDMPNDEMNIELRQEEEEEEEEERQEEEEEEEQQDEKES